MHPLSSIRPSVHPTLFCWRRPCIVPWTRSRRHCRDWRRKSKNSRLLQGKKWQGIATSCHIHDFLPLFTGRWPVLLLGQSLSGSQPRFPNFSRDWNWRDRFLNAALKMSVIQFYSMCEHWLFVRRNVPLLLATRSFHIEAGIRVTFGSRVSWMVIQSVFLWTCSINKFG